MATKEKSKDIVSPQSIQFLHKHQCNVCPLNKNKAKLNTPHMPPGGVVRADVYLLGEAPGEQDDSRGKPFMGREGRLIQGHIPGKWIDRVRYNNVVRTKPPKGRTPTLTEIECCRPSIIEDIEKTKPKAIFGFGNIPLYFAIGKDTGISLWSGKRIPIMVGSHPVWFFPMIEPASIFAKQYPKNEEEEFNLSFHLKKAFNSINKLPEPVIWTEERLRKNVGIVTGHEGDALNRVIKHIQSCYDQKTVGFDYETHRLRPYYEDAKILTVALSHSRESLAFPMGHPGSGFSKKDKATIRKEFERFLYEAPCRKAVHQLSFEQEWTGYHFGTGSLRAQPWGDSVTQSYILDERPGTHSLDFLFLQYFGVHLKAMSDVDRNNLIAEKLDTALMYNSLDGKAHWMLDAVQLKEIEAQGIMPLYENFLARVPTMVLTQLKGVPINQEEVGKFYNHFEGLVRESEREIRHLPVVREFEKRTNTKFNPGSTPDVKKLLHSLGHHVDSTDETQLSQIDHPLASALLEWRGNSKTLSTYVIPLMPPEDLETLGIDKDRSCLLPDGRIHPFVSSTKTRTSRTSSNEPNSQNYIKHYDTPTDFKVRKLIQHKNPDLKIVAFDYAGIQARNVAMESLDKTLIEAFWNNYDIHHDWSQICAKIYPDWVEDIGRFRKTCRAMKEGESVNSEDKAYVKKYRQDAKNGFVFASFFGAHPKKTASALGVPEWVTEQMFDMFWKKFPNIKGWHERLKTHYERYGYVDSLSGFRRHAPVSSNELINSGIQADESMIVCSAMNRLSEMGLNQYQPNLEVHDDLSFVWPKKSIEKNAEIVGKEMTRIAYPWMACVPIEVEMSVGDNWSELEEVAKFNSTVIWGHKR